MSPEEIPEELIRILDARAGKIHSSAGSVVTALAEILTAYDAWREAKPGETPGAVEPDDARPRAVIPEDHPEFRCHRCNGPNVMWTAPSPLWNMVMRSGGVIDGKEMYNGIICPGCFIELAERMGIVTSWRLYAEDVKVPLQTVTPSGRVWNEQTWMFEEPGYD